MSPQILIEGTDKLIHGQMNKGNVFMLSAVPGAGKTIFGIQFLEEGFREDQPGIAVVTDISSNEFISMAKTFGFEWERHVESGLLMFVDCHSYMLGRGGRGQETVSRFQVDDPENLTNVSITLSDARRDIEKGRLLLDSASTLMLLSDEVIGVKFLSNISSRMKRDGFTCVFILEGGVHDSKILNRLRYLMDGVLDIKMEEVEDERKRYFRIYSLRGCRHETKWVPFTINEKGFFLGGKP